MALFIYESDTIKVFSGSAGVNLVTNIEINKDGLHIIEHTSDELIDLEELGAQTKFLIKKIDDIIEEKRYSLNRDTYDSIRSEYGNVTTGLMEALRKAYEHKA